VEEPDTYGNQSLAMRATRGRRKPDVEGPRRFQIRKRRMAYRRSCPPQQAGMRARAALPPQYLPRID